LIYKFDNSLVIKDNNSKFGTLIHLQNQINVLETIVFPVQIGRTFCKFSVKKPFCLFGCYSIKQKELNTDYQKMNKDGLNLESNNIKVQDDNMIFEDEINQSQNNEKLKTGIDINIAKSNEIKENNIISYENIAYNQKYLDDLDIAEEFDKPQKEMILYNYRFFEKKLSQLNPLPKTDDIIKFDKIVKLVK